MMIFLYYNRAPPNNKITSKPFFHFTHLLVINEFWSEKVNPLGCIIVYMYLIFID